MFDWLRKRWRRWRNRKRLFTAICGDGYEYPARDWKFERRRIIVPKAGSQAIRQDIGKFMKHGRQSRDYRRSVKAKKKPDED